MQKELNGYLIVEVPEGAKHISVANGDGMFLLVFNDKDGQGWNEKLPKGPWSIVEPSESVCGEMVERYIYSGKTSYYAYKDYSGKKPESEDDIITDPLESFESWKRKEGFKNVVILKRK